ncbi:MAG: hypothetical protein M1826_004571 [Phylliscum demangeonii]|nr:MAG: hypothetical protein M1826_004571 [Phylliscum demangeonii]
MNFAASKNNLGSGLHFANRIWTNGGGASKMLERARTIKAKCERGSTAPHDKHEIKYDEFAEFDVFAASFTPIDAGSPRSGARSMAPLIALRTRAASAACVMWRLLERRRRV